VQQVMPEVVSTDPNTGLLSIGYSDLVPAVVSAIQQMQAEITTLQGGVNSNASTSNLTVYSPSNFSGDSVGQAEVAAGQTSVRISFSQPYAFQPIVTFSSVGSAAGAAVAAGAYVQDIDANGFTIQLNAASAAPVIFDWHSFASPAEQLTVSGGFTSPIILIVPVAAAVQSVGILPADNGSASSTPNGDSTPSTPSVIDTASSTPSTNPAPTVAPTPAPSPVATTDSQSASTTP
jgi:hypothetical protein